MSFYFKYKMDIELFINYYRIGIEYGVESIVNVKAHDFPNRLNHNIYELDNYFEKDCKIHLNKNQYYYYKEDIRGHMVKRMTEIRRETDAMVLKDVKSNAEIIDYNKNLVKSKIVGKAKVLSNEDYFEGEYFETEEIDYEYDVTFKKIFLFVWKAVEFKSNSKIIEELLMNEL